MKILFKLRAEVFRAIKINADDVKSNATAVTTPHATPYAYAIQSKRETVNALEAGLFSGKKQAF